MSYWDTCECGAEAPEDYDYPRCCDGYMCGCQGLPTEPYICDKCIEKLGPPPNPGKKYDKPPRPPKRYFRD